MMERGAGTHQPRPQEQLSASAQRFHYPPSLGETIDSLAELYPWSTRAARTRPEVQRRTSFIWQRGRRCHRSVDGIADGAPEKIQLGLPARLTSSGVCGDPFQLNLEPELPASLAKDLGHRRLHRISAWVSLPPVEGIPAARGLPW